MKIPLLQVLTKKEHKLVKGYQVTKNSVINHEGDLCENVGVIISGKVDIVSYSFQGKEQILNSLKAGDIFGNNLIFSSEPIYRGDVIAKEKFTNAEERLVYYASKNDNVITFKNVTALAAQIGIQRETLSRLLTSLVKRHLIKKEKGKITFLKKRR